MRKLLLPLTLVFLLGALLAAAVPPQEEPPRCHGRRATIVGSEGDDVLHGTPGRDVIWGGGGDDEIYGSLGNDLICGGPGSDLIHGGRGNDIVDGGSGDDDRVYGDLGDDKILGGPGNDDQVSGGLGIDTLNGGPGNFDLVDGDYGYDRMDGGPGHGDIASFATDVGAPKNGGVWASLQAHKAFGDGHDRLFRFESLEGSAFDDTLIGNRRANVIDGGPGKDTIRGGGGRDELFGGQGSDRCSGAKGSTASCGREKRLHASAYVELDTPIDFDEGAGAGLDLIGGGGPDHFIVSLDEETSTFGVTANRGIAVGHGCVHVSAVQASCTVDGPVRWAMADLGPGNDSLRVEGSLEGAQFVRLAGGLGNDTIHGGPEDDLIEGGHGSDHLYGGGGADGLIGSLPGPTYLYGGPGGDLLAAGGGCAGGALVGGPGRDDASFAETPAHPGTLHVSFPAHAAWIDAIPGCHKVHLSATDEDMEGSFDNDVLVGDGSANSMLGQPGHDRFYGGGGEDVMDARDGERDLSIQCGRGWVAKSGAVHGTPAGRALTDPFDPAPVLCKEEKHGHPVDGLGDANGNLKTGGNSS
jgi:Ca2+-binding RTX toxin-like protein